MIVQHFSSSADLAGRVATLLAERFKKGDRLFNSLSLRHAVQRQRNRNKKTAPLFCLSRAAFPRYSPPAARAFGPS